MQTSSSIRRWKPRTRLGSGFSAQVFLAVDLDDGLRFAVKCSPVGSASPSLLDNELHVLQALSSPYIVRCLGADSTIENGTPVSRNLFLEYMEGGSLAHLVKRAGGGLQEPQVRLCTRDILHGLAYLQEMGIVHCDIKGANILVGSSGHVKIADFGLASQVGPDASMSPAESRGCGRPLQTIKGTPLWMAPEVVRGREQGFPSDIWSLGCTIVEMFQGLPPWGHITEQVAALYRLGCSKECPPLPSCISEDARDFLLHCLQPDPKARWTASQLLQHPFVCATNALRAGEGAALNVMRAQASPRSPLETLIHTSHSSASHGFQLESGSSWTTSFSVGASSTASIDDHAPASASSSTARESRKRGFADAFILDWRCGGVDDVNKKHKVDVPLMQSSSDQAGSGC